MHVAERMKIVLGARAERHHRFCKPKPESFCGRASAIVSRRGNRKVWFLSLMYVASLRGKASFWNLHGGATGETGIQHSQRWRPLEMPDAF